MPRIKLLQNGALYMPRIKLLIAYVSSWFGYKLTKRCPVTLKAFQASGCNYDQLTNTAHEAETIT